MSKTPNWRKWTMQKNDTPDLKSVCGHGFEVCFSTECAKPENWSDLLRKRVIEVKHHYEAIKRITEQTRNEIGEAYHKGLNDRGEEVAALKAENEKLREDAELLFERTLEIGEGVKEQKDKLTEIVKLRDQEITRLRERIKELENAR